MEAKNNFWLKICFGAAWLVFVCWHFSQHFPFVHLPEIVLNGLMLLILLLFFMTLGKGVFRLFRLSFASLAEECCFACGVGSGVTIFLVFALATLGLLYEVLIVALILGLLLLFYRDARQLCIQGYQAFAGIARKEQSKSGIVLLLFIGCAGILTFLAAATPPFFYDALVYHLAAPQKYLLLHGFHYIPHNHSTNFPANLGLLFIVAMSFSAGFLPQLLSWAFTPLTVIFVYFFAKRRWGSQIGLTAAAILFLTPGILVAATLTTVDAGVMFYSFLSFAALLSWFESRQRAWFVLAGIFCSLAVGAKYPALVVTFLPLTMLLFFHETVVAKRGLRRGLRNALIFGVIVFTGVAPWFLKNWYYTGNPLYPFFNTVFRAQGSQIVDYQQYLDHANTLFNAEPHGLKMLLNYLRAPWLVTMTTTGAAGQTGLVFLLCLPGVFLLKKMDGPTRYLLALAGGAFWFWILLLPATLRYVFPMLPPLSIVTAHILWCMPVGRRTKSLLVGGLSMIFGYQLLIFGGQLNILRPFAYLFGNQSQEAFLLEHGLNYYPVVQYLNRETANDAKILFVGETRGYYCERDYLLYAVPYVSAVDKQEILLRQLILASENAGEVIEKLRQQRITHILFNLAEMRRFTPQYLAPESYFGFQTEKERAIFRSLFAPPYLRLLISQYQVELYEILR